MTPRPLRGRVPSHDWCRFLRGLANPLPVVRVSADNGGTDTRVLDIFGPWLPRLFGVGTMLFVGGRHTDAI